MTQEKWLLALNRKSIFDSPLKAGWATEPSWRLFGAHLESRDSYNCDHHKEDCKMGGLIWIMIGLLSEDDLSCVFYPDGWNFGSSSEDLVSSPGTFTWSLIISSLPSSSSDSSWNKPDCHHRHDFNPDLTASLDLIVESSEPRDFRRVWRKEASPEDVASGEEGNGLIFTKRAKNVNYFTNICFWMWKM